MENLKSSFLKTSVVNRDPGRSGFMGVTTQANLLIPEILWERYCIRLSRHKSGALYLRYLLKKYQEKLLFIVQHSRESCRANRIYQNRGLGLIRTKIRFPESDWKEFSELSHLTGYSCCRLYALLVNLDVHTPLSMGGEVQPFRCKLRNSWSGLFEDYRKVKRGKSVQFRSRGVFRDRARIRVFIYVKSLLV